MAFIMRCKLNTTSNIFRALVTMLVSLLLHRVVSANGGGGADDEIDFPPMLDSDDIRYYAETHDVEGLHWALSSVFRRSSRNTNAQEIVYDLPAAIVSKGGGSTYSTKYKLEMDVEQAKYLVENLKDEAKVAYLRDVVIPTYKKVLSRIPPLDQLERTGGLYAFRQADYDDGIAEVYNKAIHVPDFDVLKDSESKPLPLLNQNFDAAKIEAKWFGEQAANEDADDQLSRPGVVVIDDILSPEALARIRQLLLESTVFYQTKMPLKFGGYAGAYIDDGLHDKILLALAFELNKALPRIMKGNPLKYLWAYKYDSDYTGISTHADQAAVNVNIWLTGDEAVLDKDHGGLVVFTAKPPPGSDFDYYNKNTERAIEEIIAPTAFANVTVPFRYNRCVMFDSALFHHTDIFSFKKGYKNRRINLTLLYGEMKTGGVGGAGNAQDEL
mmetsp:Transcript_17277/g.49494  ORF Transcript_17277/g.49494 Transcript_17277/m.49494 type:complete len:441 (-) Transcript_17277:96-1418(-)